MSHRHLRKRSKKSGDTISSDLWLWIGEGPSVEFARRLVTVNPGGENALGEDKLFDALEDVDENDKDGQVLDPGPFDHLKRISKSYHSLNFC